MECDQLESSEEQQLEGRQQPPQQHQEGPVEKKMRPASEFAEYDKLLDRLADRLKIARHPDSLVTLKAARILIENVLSSSSDKQHHNEQGEQTSGRRHERHGGDDVDETKIQQSKFSLHDIGLPKSLLMKSHDESARQQQVTNEPSNDDNSEKDDLEQVFERSARALKLLYLDDQKQLQNRVNEIISAIQSITANPKTDPSLLTSGR